MEDSMLGSAIRELRKKHKLTQEQLSVKLEVATSTIGMYEQGRRLPDAQTLKNIANIFNVSVDYLLGMENELSCKSNQWHENYANDYNYNNFLVENMQILTLGSYIKSLREIKKYSQRKLALSSGLSNTTISRIENNLVTPDTESLNKIAIALDTPLENFLSYTFSTNVLFRDNFPTKYTNKDIVKDIQEIIAKIDSDKEGLLYYNNQKISDETKELFRDALEFALKIVKVENKQKYTPKKYGK